MSILADRVPNSVKVALAALWPALLLAYGLWSVPLAVFGPGRDMTPGNLGDARFNNYVLEHFHQYTTGNVEGYWDAPYMYPYKNVIALSDNLLGTAPFYSLCRRAGFNRESAYQLWVLAMFTLNYLCCYLALVLWSKRSALAAGGAFIFAFGIHMIEHLEHAQVFPKFMVPIAFWFCWQWLRTGRMLHFLFAALAVAYQLYCSIPLGVVLCYALLFLVVGFAVVTPQWITRVREVQWRTLAAAAGVILIVAALLSPMVLPYCAGIGTDAPHAIVPVVGTTPASYFTTHPAALSWQNLSTPLHSVSQGSLGHFNFMGAIPWLAVLLLPVMLWRSRTDVPARRPLMAVGIGFVLCMVFFLQIGDTSLYSLLHMVPGIRTIGPIDRVIAVQSMYFALLTTMVFAMIGDRTWSKALIGLCVPLLILLENKMDATSVVRSNKFAAKGMVDRIVLDMQLQRNNSAQALAYAPARSVLPEEKDRERMLATQLGAMLAGQQLGVAVVNGYAELYPAGYLELLHHMDQRSLDDWCRSNNIAPEHVQLVNNIHQPILAMDTVHLIASNGAHLSVDTVGMVRVVDPGSDALLRGTFVRLRLSPTHYAFLAANENFLSAALHQDSSLVATSDRLGDMGIFTMKELPDDNIALRADNGMYVEWQQGSQKLIAKATTGNERTRFRIVRQVP